MGIDWVKIQDELFVLSKAEIDSFVMECTETDIYGFGFDCNADYGTVLLCFNSEKEFLNSCKGFPNESKVWLQTKLRWNTGDWKYQGINSDQFNARWLPYEREIHKQVIEQWMARDLQSAASMFLNSVCEVLVRLENWGGLRRLNQTESIRLFAGDESEDVAVSWERLAGIRQSGINPELYQDATRFADFYHECHGIYNTIETERRKLPYSEEKKLLKACSIVPPQPRNGKWWLVYESKNDPTFEVSRSATDQTYCLRLNDGDERIVSSADELVLQLRKSAKV